jgi:hypothetical protein
VRGRATARGDDPLRDGHAVEVVRRGLDADEDDLLAPVDPLDGVVGVEHGPTHRRAGRGVESLDDPPGRLERRGIERVAKELVHVSGFDPTDRVLRRDQALLDHVDGDLHRGRGGPFRRPRLEHVQLAAFDRELEVLDVPVVLLELLADPLELRVDLWHVGLHLADLRRRPDAGHDVLALGIGQVLAVERLLAGVRVTGEGCS